MTYTLDPPLPRTDTPSDYHRVHFDTSQLPTKRIVGLLACQRDPLLRALKTTVTAARPATIAAPPLQKGKIAKKESSPNTPTDSASGTPNGAQTPSGKLWEVEVEDTVIFPEGGGQPFDTGTLVLDGGKEFVVEGCLRRKLDSVHLVRVPDADAGALEGLEGKEVELRVDWERRMDHMSIHTAQHLLSAILDVWAEGLPTLSWSMPAFPSLEMPSVELPRGLTWAEVEEVERRCNEAIEAATKVWVDVDVQQEGYIKESATGVRENRGIPSDYTDGVIRHINITDIDKNACCGTQLPHLGFLKTIHIIPPSLAPDSDKPSKSATRLFFVSGPRASKYLAQTSRTLSQAAHAIGAGRGDVVNRVTRLDESRKELLGREKDLRSELASSIGGSLSVGLQGRKVIWVKRSEKSTHDFEFSGMIASSVLAAGGYAGQVVIVTSTPPDVLPSLVLISSTEQESAKKAHELLKAGFEGLEGGKGRYKGGGAKGRYMSKVDGKWGAAEEELVRSVIGQLEAEAA